MEPREYESAITQCLVFNLSLRVSEHPINYFIRIITSKHICFQGNITISSIIPSSCSYPKSNACIRLYPCRIQVCYFPRDKVDKILHYPIVEGIYIHSAPSINSITPMSPIESLLKLYRVKGFGFT